MSADRVVLSRIFSREKPLFYFQLWNDTDRLGFRDFLGHEIRHSVFLVPPKGERGSVWYSTGEWDEVIESLRKKIVADEQGFIAAITERADQHWPVLMEYLSREKPINSVEAFEDYYEHLVQWWSAMTAVWELPNIPEPSEEAREAVLSRRAVGEKYTEEMSRVLVEAVERVFPQIAHLSSFVSVPDITRISESGYVAALEARARGCVMVDEKIFPYTKLDEALLGAGVVLEEEVALDTAEVKGATAYKGLVRGKVRIVRTKAVMKEFEQGEILVTEMTNPDYVPIMKKAGAIVTDEGGMMCHASIVSRELQIPCVVGTKVATKVFKDGDLVEVDAVKGIVRKV